MAKITVLDTDISIVRYNEEDYISLTDMAVARCKSISYFVG